MDYPRTKTAVAVALLAAIPVGLLWNENRKLKHELSLGMPGGKTPNSENLEHPRRSAGPHLGAARADRMHPSESGAGRGSGSAQSAEWQRALREQDPVRRSQRIAALMATLNLENAPAIAEIFFGEDVERTFNSEAALFLRAWAKIDGAQTIAYLEGKNRAGAASSAMLAALAGWASSTPASARAWAEKVENGTLREDLLFGVIDGWTLIDFKAAADYAETRPRSDARTRFIELLFQRSMAAGGVAGTQNWFAGISNNDHNKVFKRRAFERIAGTILGRDPAEAAQWIASQAGGEFVSRQAVQSTALKLAESSHEEALRWIDSMPTLSENVSAASLAHLVSQWAGHDPEAAREWMSAHANHASYDVMASDYSAAVAGSDGESALEWARSIGDEARRQAAVVEVARRRIQAKGDGVIEDLRLAGLSEEELTLARRLQNRLILDGVQFSNASFTISPQNGSNQVELHATDAGTTRLWSLETGEPVPLPTIPVSPGGSTGK